VSTPERDAKDSGICPSLRLSTGMMEWEKNVIPNASGNHITALFLMEKHLS